MSNDEIEITADELAYIDEPSEAEVEAEKNRKAREAVRQMRTGPAGLQGNAPADKLENNPRPSIPGVVNSADASSDTPIMMAVYGMGGVGKSTFAATAKTPLFLDLENGTKYFGARDIDVDVIQIKKWSDIEKPETRKAIEHDYYKTIVIDPVGELMQSIIEEVEQNGGSQYRNSVGLTQMGWGYVKKRVRQFLKYLMRSGKDVILVAHIDEKMLENSRYARLKVATSISDEIVNMCDVVGYMEMVTTKEGVTKRVIRVEPESEQHEAKDRTGQLDKIVAPDFQVIKSTINKS